MNRSWLEEMDQLRYDDPEGALEQLLAKAGSTPAELEAHYLGVCGSAYRNLACRSIQAAPALEQAREHIALGLWIAGRRGDTRALGDLLLRKSYVVAEHGDYAESLALAERASGLFDRAGHRPGRGKALADQGLYLYNLGRLEEAVSAYAAALELLPREDRRCWCSAHQVSGLCFLKLGQPRKALEYAERAVRFVPDSVAWKTKLRWFQASVLTDLDELELAESQLGGVVEALQSIHYGEAALASCDLVRVQVLRGRPGPAWETAVAAHALVFPLSGHRVVAGALVELFRGGRQALSLELVGKVKATLEKARERREWRSLAVS